MNLIFRSHHTTVPDDLRDHAADKLARLERLLPRVDDVIVEVEYEETRSAAHRYAVQVTVHSGGIILRGEERATDAQLALDRAAGVITRQARRHGGRLHDKHRSGPGKGIAAPSTPSTEQRDDDGTITEYVAGKVVRVKQFEAKPMSEEEALAQMDLLGHDFFLFLDTGTNSFALLYKRKDGDYGLLAPHSG